jgi:hypothetical protein
MLRLKGKTKKNFFGNVHELWYKHESGVLPFMYFDRRFKRVSKEDSYKFVTLDPTTL